MYFHRIVRECCPVEYWKIFVEQRLLELKMNFEPKKHGLDLTKSGFIKSEVFKADECIHIARHGKTLGYVFLLTKKRPRALYITLMVSFEKNMGTQIINFLENANIYEHEFISLRATIQSIGFYVKLDFKIFDFITMEDYVNGCVSETLTHKISDHIKDTKQLQIIQKEIVEIDWMPHDSDEFPMLKKRKYKCASKMNVRKSPRLQH